MFGKPQGWFLTYVPQLLRYISYKPQFEPLIWGVKMLHKVIEYAILYEIIVIMLHF